MHFNRGELSWFVSSFASLLFDFLLWFRILVYSFILNEVFFVLLYFFFLHYFLLFWMFFCLCLCGFRSPLVQNFNTYRYFEDTTDLVTKRVWSRPQVSAPSSNFRHLALWKGEDAEFFSVFSLLSRRYPPPARTHTNTQLAPFCPVSLGQGHHCEWGVLVPLPSRFLLPISITDFESACSFCSLTQCVSDLLGPP